MSADIEKRVVIRLMAESQMEELKRGTKIIRNMIAVSKKADQSIGKWITTMQKSARAAHAKRRADRAVDKALEDLNEEIAENGEHTRRAKQLMDKARSAYEKFEEAARNAAKAEEEHKESLNKSMIAASLAIKGTSKLTKTLGSLAKKGLQMAITSLKMFAATAAALGTAGAKNFMDLNREIAKIGLVMRQDLYDAQLLQSALYDMSKRSIFGAKELGQAMFEVGAMMGDISSEELARIVDLGQQVAIATGFEDATEASELLVGVFRMFGDESKDATKTAEEQITDFTAMLMNAANDTALSMGDIQTALQFVGGTAAAMDQPLEQVLAALGMLRNTGMEASVASTALNMVLTNLSDPSDEASKWMRRLGIEITNADGSFRDFNDIMADVAVAFDEDNDIFRDSAHRMEVLQEMFGVRGARAVSIFTETLEDNADALYDMSDAFGNTEQGIIDLEEKYSTFMATPSALFDIMKNQLYNLSTMLGEAFLMDEEGNAQAFLQEIIDLLNDDAFKTMMQAFGKALANLANAVIPILVDAFTVLMPVITDFLNLISEIISSPEFQGFMQALMTLISYVGNFLVKAFKKLMPAILKVFAVLNDLSPILSFIVMLFQVLTPIINIIIHLFIILFKIIMPFIPLFIIIGKVFGQVFGLITLVLLSLADIVLSLLQLLAEAWGFFTQDYSFRDSIRDARGDLDEMITASGELASGKAFDDDWMDDITVPTYDEEGNPVNTSPIGGGAGGGGGGSTIINIQGDVRDEELIDRMNERVNDEAYSQGFVPPH